MCSECGLYEYDGGDGEVAECPACECLCDACPCETDWCDDCKCGTDHSSSCKACSWYFKTTGAHNPCGWGDVDTPNETCAYYDDWLNAQSEPIDENRHFSVKRIDAVKPEEVTASGEWSVARQLGLDNSINMAQACADFYVLERLYQDSHDIAERYDVQAQQYRMDIRVPMEAGRDNRAERLAIAIGKTREFLNTELSRQLLTYMIMAVGGEVRHAPNHASRVRDKRGTPKSKWPKPKFIPPLHAWREWPTMLKYGETPEKIKTYRLTKYGCPACYEYLKTTGTGSPCNRIGIKILPRTKPNPDCAYFFWWAKNEGITIGEKTVIQYRPHTPRMREFFGNQDISSSEMGRGLAWREWLIAYTHHGPTLLKDCEEVFRKWKWPSSYGGSKWAEAAEFAKMFASGNMRSDAFLDRVWTLEHNGGNLFNKYYRRGINELHGVLEIQANDEQHYPTLIKHASPYVKELYAEAQALGILNRSPMFV